MLQCVIMTQNNQNKKMKRIDVNKPGTAFGYLKYFGQWYNLYRRLTASMFEAGYCLFTVILQCNH